MPKIGLRIIKSAIAVFICSLICYVRSLIPLAMPESGLDGMVFYSAIAAVICMQPEISNSFKMAKDRIFGTLLGGIYALTCLLIFSRLPDSYILLRYFLISIAIIPLIRMLVWLKHSQTTLLACTVFLSVTVLGASNDSPLISTSNRMLDTIFGIIVSLCVNIIPFLRFKDENVLFVSDLDGTLLNSSGKVSAYTAKKLNKLIKNGAKITVATARTPITIVPLLSGINFELPIIAMNGSAIYDLSKKEYIFSYKIPYNQARIILNVFEEHGCNCFTHTISGNNLNIYYNRISNPVEKEFFEERKSLEGKNYINGVLPEGCDVVYFTCITTLVEIRLLMGSIESLSFNDQIQATYYKDVYNKGYYFLEIYNKEASKINAARMLCDQYKLESVVAFGDNYNDLELIKNADTGYAVSNAIPKIKEQAECVIGSNDKDSVIKTIDKLFFHK